MRIGHVFLASESEDTRQHLTVLVRALSVLGIEQHALVGDETLAQVLGSIDSVTVGPLVRTPIMACCLMPNVDLAHIHDIKGAQTGLLLALTRSVTYIITQRSTSFSASNAIMRSAYRRARCIVCQSEPDRIDMRSQFPDSLIELIHNIGAVGSDDAEIPAERAAAEHMRLYRQMIDNGRLPALML